MEQSKIPEKLYALETSMQSFAHVAYQISYALKIISVNIGTVGSQLERARDALIEGNCDIEKYLDNAQDFLNKTSQSTNEIMCRLMKVRGGGRTICFLRPLNTARKAPPVEESKGR